MVWPWSAKSWYKSTMSWAKKTFVSRPSTAISGKAYSWTYTTSNNNSNKLGKKLSSNKPTYAYANWWVFKRNVSKAYSWIKNAVWKAYSWTKK